MGCKNSCRILFPIYNCRGKGSFFCIASGNDTNIVNFLKKIFFLPDDKKSHTICPAQKKDR